MQCLHIQTDIQCGKLFYLGKCTFSSPGQRSSELVIKEIIPCQGGQNFCIGCNEEI